MLHTLLIHLADATPEPKDVKAGWTAFVIFLLMFAAVVGLGFSMARQFKKARLNKEAGVLPSTAAPAVTIPVASAGNSQES